MNILQKTYSKLYRESRYLCRDIGHVLGLNEKFYQSASGSRIMIYHGICKQDHLQFNTIFLKLKTFEAHLKFYKKYCHVISLADFYQQRFNQDKFNICLTFDDGFANNYKYVLPLLEQYQMPATFFITAIRDAGQDILWNDFLAIFCKYGPETLTYKGLLYYKNNTNKYIAKSTGLNLAEMLRSTNFDEKLEMMRAFYPMFPFKEKEIDEDYWLQMDKEQIRKLAESPWVTIGAHGYYHNDMARINIHDAGDELFKSKQYLEKIITRRVDSFAFPYGTYTPELVKVAKQTGYTQILGLDFQNKEDHLDAAMRERFTVNPFISVPNQMYTTIKGKYE